MNENNNNVPNSETEDDSTDMGFGNMLNICIPLSSFGKKIADEAKKKEKELEKIKKLEESRAKAMREQEENNRIMKRRDKKEEEEKENEEEYDLGR